MNSTTMTAEVPTYDYGDYYDDEGKEGAPCQIVMAFCQEGLVTECENTTIARCAHCNVPGIRLFLFVVFLLSFLIVSSNAFVLHSIRRSRSEEKVKFHYMKASLAIADILNGLNLACVAIPNIFWTLGVTSAELEVAKLALDDTVSAKLGALLFLFFFSSTQYQIALMSALRLYGVVRPWANQKLTRHHVRRFLVVTWLVAAVVATVPLWFPDYFVLEYQRSTFLYMLGLRRHDDKKSYLISVTFFVIFPYFFMAITTLMTWVVARRGLGKTFSVDAEGKVVERREHRHTRKVVFIEIGFALATLPYLVNISLINLGVLTCETLPQPNLVTFYIFYCRSLVNILVYSVFERSFKRALWRKICSKLDMTSQHLTAGRTSVNGDSISASQY